MFTASLDLYNSSVKINHMKNSSNQTSLAMKNVDVLVFGYGEVVSNLICELIKEGLSVICVTRDITAENHIASSRNLHFYDYLSITNIKIRALTSIVAWRDINYLLDQNTSFLDWFNSDFLVVGKNVLLSSASVYRNSYVPLTESNDSLDLNVASNKKYILENELDLIMNKKNVSNHNLRISNIYGENIAYGLIGSIFSSIKSGAYIQIESNQQIVRDYVHISDVIFAIKSLLHLNIDRQTINVSTGVGTSIYEIVNLFLKEGYDIQNKFIYGRQDILKTDSVLNCDKLASMILWEPIKIEIGLKKALAKLNLDR
jgi:nucleoside-diphosphate-sugar epimerase